VSFLLDTDTVSFALRGAGRVAGSLRAQRPSAVGVSSITVAELYFDAEKRGSRKLRELLTTFFSAVEAHPFDAAAARRYGQVAATLAAAGEPIGMADAMIAAHALELGATLVTHNRKHFQRIDGLDVVDWF